MVMESLQRLDPPLALGKLTLLARLGEGGMATVYVAATGQGNLARLCAVKLLRAGVPDLDYRARFLDEAKLVVRLHHNNVVDVREAGEQDGQLFIVMELCEGRDLADVWDRCAEVGRAFPVPLAVHIVREALRGLHYAHIFPGLGLVHRDVSPSNLLIDWAGAVRVADFGLATSALKAAATMPGMVFGKVGYMAPEQATRGELDPRADVYSCGVVLWELLTGRPLRESGIDTKMVARFSAAPPSSLSRRVDPVLDEIVVRALQTRPEDRFASAADFMRALTDWLAANAPTTGQETLADFMRGLFGEAQQKDHEIYAGLLASLPLSQTGRYGPPGEVNAPTRDMPALAGPEDLPTGTVVAQRYRVVQPLGRGGMGIVYLAEHVTVGRKVAVKVLTREWSAHEIVARRFKAEARAASAAGHPNIVEVFDAGELPDGRLFLVMEHLEGRSLYEELAALGPMHVTRASAVFGEISRAVAAAHAVGIIHRDLKPDNVMLVRRQGRQAVKVLDFGISANAERLAVDRRLTQPGHALGTPEYMAPEQAKGHPPTERVDIYALGVILYEMLAGRPPFSSENMIEVLTRKATEPAPALQQLRPDVPSRLAALVHACLEIDPARRPQSVEDVLAALDDALVDSTGSALVPIDPTRSGTAGRSLARTKPPSEDDEVAAPSRLPVIIAAIASAIFAGAALLWVMLPEPRSPPVPGVETSQAGTVPGAIAKPTPGPSAPSEPVRPSPVPGAPGGTTRGEVDDPPPPAGPSATDPVPSPPADRVVAQPKRKSRSGRAGRSGASSASSAAADSDECKQTRASADAAKRERSWSTVLAALGSSKCWSGPYRSEAQALRVRALFESGRFEECAAAGAKSTQEKVQSLASVCARRAGKTG